MCGTPERYPNLRRGALRALLCALIVAPLASCATCREHPAQCAAAVVVTGAIAARELDQRGQRRDVERPCFNLGAEACR